MKLWLWPLYSASMLDRATVGCFLLLQTHTMMWFRRRHIKDNISANPCFLSWEVEALVSLLLQWVVDKDHLLGLWIKLASVLIQGVRVHDTAKKPLDAKSLAFSRNSSHEGSVHERLKSYTPIDEIHGHHYCLCPVDLWHVLLQLVSFLTRPVCID
jgi:hypothetical protein